jgi:probable rRNA maturation factor
MGVDVTDRAALLPRRGRASAARLRNAGTRLLAAVDHESSGLSLAIVGDREMKRLNREYRGRDRTTDVLSFSQLEGDEVPACDEIHLGDVVISLPRARSQARFGGWTLEEELLRLLVHGVLHALGYDHEKSRREALRMRREELRLCDALAREGYPCAREDGKA